MNQEERYDITSAFGLDRNEVTNSVYNGQLNRHKGKTAWKAVTKKESGVDGLEACDPSLQVSWTFSSCPWTQSIIHWKTNSPLGRRTGA